MAADLPEETEPPSSYRPSPTSSARNGAEGLLTPPTMGPRRRWHPEVHDQDSKASGITGSPGVLGVPGVPGAAGLPEVPGVPGAAAVPGVADVPGLREVLGVLGRPEVPGVLQGPEGPETPAAAAESGFFRRLTLEMLDSTAVDVEPTSSRVPSTPGLRA